MAKKKIRVNYSINKGKKTRDIENIEYSLLIGCGVITFGREKNG